MPSRILKSSSFNDIRLYDKEYWWAKTPQERLDAALKLIKYAKAIYKANPNNPPLAQEGVIIKSRTPIERYKLATGRQQDVRGIE